MLDKVAEQNHEYYVKNKEKWQTVYKETPEHHRERNKRLQHTQKLLVLTHYSKGTPKCAWCGIEDFDVLTLDHINGGGTQHRKLNPHSYRWAIKENLPEGFQVLCFNCNWKKHVIKRT